MAITALKAPANLSKTAPKAPSYLKKAGRELWISIMVGFELESHHVVLLDSLCQTLDRRNQAEQELRAEGALTFKNRHGEPRAHAAVAIVRDCSVLIARLTRELNLSELDADPRRPPALRYGGRK